MENKNLERRRFKAKDKDGNPIWIITANSIVTEPAIEKNFELFSLTPHLRMRFNTTNTNQSFKIADEEKQIIVGIAMTPNKDILRYDEVKKKYYNGYFTEEDVRDFAEMFIQSANTAQANFEHTSIFTDKIRVIESWIVEDPNNDKTNALGLKNIVKGDWAFVYKVYDKEMWQDIKNGIYKGFSVEIETVPVNELDNLPTFAVVSEDITDIKEDLFVSMADKKRALRDIINYHSFVRIEELSFADYPESAITNAKKALEYKSANPELKCGNNLMWNRCKQIVNKQPLSYSTLKRISLLLKSENKANASAYDYGCAKVMWDAFGGAELIYWASTKLSQIDALIKAENEKIKSVKPTSIYPYR